CQTPLFVFYISARVIRWSFRLGLFERRYLCAPIAAGSQHFRLDRFVNVPLCQFRRITTACLALSI
ncbi:MAG: hypothetical protein VX149_00295, partial [Pseudomonadota bacterium]|nr:hypothetical protein [Pseudomonadota bacterium]